MTSTTFIFLQPVDSNCIRRIFVKAAIPDLVEQYVRLEGTRKYAKDELVRKILFGLLDRARSRRC